MGTLKHQIKVIIAPKRKHAMQSFRAGYMWAFLLDLPVV